MKSNRITRLMQMLTTFQAGKRYAVTDLAKLFGTSRRTIFRDLKELEAVGVPYHYDAQEGGYVIEPEFFLPPVDFTLQEALSLLLLVHKSGGHIQVPFKRSALLAALKIENNLPAAIRQYCSKAMQNITTRGSAQAPAEMLDRTFARLQTAIIKKSKVTMLYDSFFEGKNIEVELCPYHLFYNNRAWYVAGRSNVHNSIRTFKLNRIKELQLTDECFTGPERFDLDEYLGRAWSMIPEGRLYDVKLRFLPKVAGNVAEVRWHSTQQVTHNSDGSATMEFRVDGLGEITWWILGYGDQVEVLAPKQLRDRIIQIAENMVRLNDQPQGA